MVSHRKGGFARPTVFPHRPWCRASLSNTIDASFRREALKAAVAATALPLRREGEMPLELKALFVYGIIVIGRSDWHSLEIVGFAPITGFISIMKDMVKKQRWQVVVLVMLCCLWHMAWIRGMLSGKGFIGNLNMIWGVVFFFVPFVFLYLFARYVWGSRANIKKRILPICVVLSFAMLPIFMIWILIRS